DLYFKTSQLGPEVTSRGPVGRNDDGAYGRGRHSARSPVRIPSVAIEPASLVAKRGGKSMGKIVAAMATMHAPQLFTRPPEEDPEQPAGGVAAVRRLGEQLDKPRPDALIVLASDHLETFFLKSVPTFAIIAGERAKTVFAGRTWAPAVHQSLAEDILEKLVR